MKVILDTNYQGSEHTVEALLAGRVKEVFVITTYYAIYKSNTMTGVFNLWRRSGDDSGVQKFEKVG